MAHMLAKAEKSVEYGYPNGEKKAPKDNFPLNFCIFLQDKFDQIITDLNGTISEGVTFIDLRKNKKNG